MFFVPIILAVIGAGAFLFEVSRHRRSVSKINEEIKSLNARKKHMQQQLARQTFEQQSDNGIRLNLPQTNPQKQQNGNSTQQPTPTQIGRRVGIAVGAATIAGGAAYLATQAAKNQQRPHQNTPQRLPQIPALPPFMKPKPKKPWWKKLFNSLKGKKR